MRRRAYGSTRAWRSPRSSNRICIVHALDCRGTIAHALGDYALARERYVQGLARAREWDDRVEAPWLLHNLGSLALDQGDYAAARAWLTQGLTSRSEYDNPGFVQALAEFATLASAEGLPEAALRIPAIGETLDLC